VELSITSAADFKELVAKVDKILTIVDSEVKPSSGEWMKSIEAKKVLKCSDSTLKNYRDKNLVEWKKVGGTYFHRLDQLLIIKNYTHATDNIK
jgi:hypothetical protein